MHIGFITSDLSHESGWSHYSLSLIQALRREGVFLTVLTTRNSPDVDDLPLLKILPNLRPPDPYIFPRLAALTPRVRAILRDCDAIHVTTELFGPLGAWSAGQKPLFITAHGSYVHIDHYRRWPVNRIYRRAFHRARVVCVSHYTARVAQSVMPGLQTAVVNNGVDVERFDHLPDIHIPKRGPTVLTVGGIKARKGTLELVRAIAVVREQIPDVQCVVIGSAASEPGYVARVQRTIADLDLVKNVHLLGFVPEPVLMSWYGAADVFALPSINSGWKFEGYGLAHIEASAAGLPVIGTLDCGAEDAIDNGVTGLLIPQTDIDAVLPQAILTLLKDKELAARLGWAGRQRAARQTWDHVAEQMIELYAAVLR